MNIYFLHLNNSNKPFYVGLTTGSLKIRLSGHICDMSNTYKARYIRKRISEGFTINITLLEKVDTIEMLNIKEQWWINFFKKKGYLLVNTTIGGEGFKNSLIYAKNIVTEEILFFKSSKHCAQHFNVSPSLIVRKIKNQYPLQGYIVFKNNISKPKEKCKPKRLRKPVEIFYKNGELYKIVESIGDASKLLNVPHTLISRGCRTIANRKKPYLIKKKYYVKYLK